MEKIFTILTQEFGLQTVIKAIIVCVVMMVVKKIKPNLSPKVEVVIRLALSVIIHLLFTLITKGEYLDFAEDVTCICGVSMIFSAITKKDYKKEEIKDAVSTFLPDFDTDKIDEIIKQTEKEENIITIEPIEEEKERISIGN